MRLRPPAAIREAPAAAIFLAAGLALTAAYFVVRRGSASQNDLYDLVGVASSLAIALGVRLNRPDYRSAWLLFAGGNLSFAVADIIFNNLSNPPTPSVADYFYLGGYPLLAVGLVMLLVRAGGHHRVAAIGEAAIVTVAFALFQWVWILDGIVGGGGSTAHRVVDAAYPAMDIVLLAGLAGFFVTAAWRTPAFLLLVSSIVALLVSDEIYGVTANSYRSGAIVDVGWLLGYILWAAAALHPSMRELSQPRRSRRTSHVHPARIALLTAALLSAPFALLVQYARGVRIEVPPYVIAGTAISLLVVLRLYGILRALGRVSEQERSARADAEQAQMLLALQNDQLLEADKLKDEFVALISHDLRTPLTSIIGYVELALDEGETTIDEERRGYLQVVSRSSDRLLRLVDDLLFVARLQSGKLAIDRTPLDLCTLAKQAVEEARPRAEAKHLALEFSGRSPVVADVDKGRIFQLLDNLISNAIKFTPEGGRIDVRAAAHDGKAALKVSDTGIGLTPNETGLVFDRFFRSEHVVAQQVPGTGLGLFIARAIVEAHDGTIGVTSREGRGTTFRIELPAGVTSPVVDKELVA